MPTHPHSPHLKPHRRPPSTHANSALPCCVRSKNIKKRPGHNTKPFINEENMSRPVKNPSKSARSRQKAISNTRDQDSCPTPMSPKIRIILNDSDGYQLIGCSPTYANLSNGFKILRKVRIFSYFCRLLRPCARQDPQDKVRKDYKREIKIKRYDIKRD